MSVTGAGGGIIRESPAALPRCTRAASRNPQPDPSFYVFLGGFPGGQVNPDKLVDIVYLLAFSIACVSIGLISEKLARWSVRYGRSCISRA